jgi:hypothetical protein
MSVALAWRMASALMSVLIGYVVCTERQSNMIEVLQSRFALVASVIALVASITQ